MQLLRLMLIGLIASTSAALAAKAPWSSGEKLVYRLNWVGVEAGELQIVAQAQGAGWRFQGKLIPKGLGVLLGYGFEVESVVDEQLHTLRFVKTLVEPFKGTSRLLAERSASQEPLVATVIEPSGQRRSYKADVRELLDELSAIYFLRVNPDVKNVQIVDFNSIIQGRLEVLGKSEEGLLGYRITQDGLVTEIWLRGDARRTPVKLVFGGQSGRLEAQLIE